MKKLTSYLLREALDRKGYRWLDDEKPYHLNIIAIRSEDKRSNSFNDLITVSYLDRSDSPHFVQYKATTDPGLYWRKNPINTSGTAILKPGQYLDCWGIGAHQGKYKALVQNGGKNPMTVYRDANRDEVLNWENVKQETGYFGINLHRATPQGESAQVDRWSAGCQVLASSTSFFSLMSCANHSLIFRANHFSYTLLEEKDL